MNNLFYIIFLAQILLVSALAPYLVGRRLRKVLDALPASTHPQLYPRPLASYRIGLTVFAWFNRLLVVAGLALMVIVYRGHGTETPIPESWPAFFGGVQFLPMLVMDLFYLNLFRRLRDMRPVKQRSARLAPRLLTDFVPQWLLALAVAMMAAAVFTDLYLHGFVVEPHTLVRNLTVLATNGLLALLGWHKLRGRSVEPHSQPGSPPAQHRRATDCPGGHQRRLQHLHAAARCQCGTSACTISTPSSSACICRPPWPCPSPSRCVPRWSRTRRAPSARLRVSRAAMPATPFPNRRAWRVVHPDHDHGA